MKVVYGNTYFCKSAFGEVPLKIKKVYQRALARLKKPFEHNVIKVSRDFNSVTLLNYPHLKESAHPYLSASLLIPLKSDRAIKYRREISTNPVILHRLEEMLESTNPRIPDLQTLTKREEELGFYSKQHIRFIGRQKYWNQLCRRAGLIESLSPETKDGHKRQKRLVR